MARRGKKRSRKGRRSYNSSFHLSIPMSGMTNEKLASTISLHTLLGDDSTFKGIPWRLRSVKFQLSVQTKIQVNPAPAYSSYNCPAIVQLSLHGAGNNNVENIVCQRYMIKDVPRTVVLRPRNPNLWKEDEQRGQALISIYNVPAGEDGNMTQLIWIIEAMIQFGRVPWTLPSTKIQVFRPDTDEDDDDHSSFMALST